MDRCTPLAQRVAALSEAEWGRDGVVRIVGASPALAAAQHRLERFAPSDSPFLITGESGVGKELFARSAYLLSPRRGQPFLSVNCAQFTDENLLISELFGHKKGAFTGAMSDRKGVFEEAHGGVLFLDEVGELTPRAQAALLRAIGAGEVCRLGESRSRRVDVRVVAATNRDLPAMVTSGDFREDLFYRLGYLRLHIPPVRERGADWRLIAESYLVELYRRHRNAKGLSPAAWALLETHAWPGNVREIRGLLDMACCLSTGDTIERADLDEGLSRPAPLAPPPPTAADAPLAREPAHASRLPTTSNALAQIKHGTATFWSAIRDPYINRDLNRSEVQRIVEYALAQSGWSYKRALRLFGLHEGEYLKFMDFLRHHQLKPERYSSVSDDGYYAAAA